MVTDVITHFQTNLGAFYSAASAGITGYVVPIAWAMLGISMMVWCYAVIEGKVTTPLTDWIFKFVCAMIVIYAMSGGYLKLVAEPIFNLGDELQIAVASHVLPGSGSTAVDIMSRLDDKIINLLTVIFKAAGEAVKALDFGSFALLIIFGLLVAVATLLLIGAAVFFYVFAKVGLSLVLGVGPFFIFGLLNQHTRNYFFSWLNTALYFVFYQLLTVMFVLMFLSILDSYLTSLFTTLGGSTYSITDTVLNIMGLGPVKVNVIAVLTPVIVISFAMFFMLLQLPTIASSMTSGSGGSFGHGMYSIVQTLRGGGKGGGSGPTPPSPPSPGPTGGGGQTPKLLPPPR
jgi:type IV secretion system protein VirB6